MQHRLGPRLAILLSAAAIGCAKGEPQTNGTRGELGRVEFFYQRSCLFGCSLDQPLLEGTNEQIELSSPGDADGVSVVSSDPDVATYVLERACHCERSDSTQRLQIREDAQCPGVWRIHCDNHVLVQAGDSGEAELELRDARGDAIDRTRVLVREASDARFSAMLPDRLGAQVGDRFELATDSSLELSVTLFDAQGLELLAPEGVGWHVADVTVATISGFLTGSRADLLVGKTVSAQAVGPGDTKVLVAVPGLDTSIDLHVRD